MPYIGIKIVVCKCLAHLANLRQSIFENFESRIAYVTLLVTELHAYLKMTN